MDDITPVTMYRSNDGKIWDTELEARTHISTEQHTKELCQLLGFSDVTGTEYGWSTYKAIRSVVKNWDRVKSLIEERKALPL